MAINKNYNNNKKADDFKYEVLEECGACTARANGDVVKAAFPNMKVDVSGGVIRADRYTQFDLSWWNAPYQKGDQVL